MDNKNNVSMLQYDPGVPLRNKQSLFSLWLITQRHVDLAPHPLCEQHPPFLLACKNIIAEGCPLSYRENAMGMLVSFPSADKFFGEHKKRLPANESNLVAAYGIVSSCWVLIWSACRPSRLLNLPECYLNML